MRRCEFYTPSFDGRSSWNPTKSEKKGYAETIKVAYRAPAAQASIPPSHDIVSQAIAVSEPSIGPLVLGTGYWVLGTGYWVLGTGYWVLGTGYWVLGTGYWVLGTGYWVLGTGYWVLGTGYWVLGTGYWVLGTGYWVHSFLIENKSTPPQRKLGKKSRFP